MVNPVSSINVVSQIGQESSPGGGTATTTKLKSMSIMPGREMSIRDIMAAGHRFATSSVIDKAWSSFEVQEDAMTYTEHLYCLENLFGTTGFGSNTLTNLGAQTVKRVYVPALTGSITPKTWIQQWGDPIDNVNDYVYGLLTDYGETWDRESGVKQSGTKGIARTLVTGSSFTTSPQTLPEIAISAQDFNIYLDTTGAALGGTQITDEIAAIDWSITGIKAARWAANRNYSSFGGHVDMRPKAGVKFTIYEDSVARGIVSQLVSGTRYFLRLNGTSSVLTENSFLVTLGSPSSGSFSLTYKGQTASGIAYNAIASTVQTDLAALSTIGAGNVTVTGSTGGPYTVTLTGPLAQDSADALTGNGGSLVGGTFSITNEQLFYVAQRDFCIVLNKTNPLKDNKGIYGQELDFSVDEDSTWGNAMILTSQTPVASL
jgi:hypothetical protein